MLPAPKSIAGTGDRGCWNQLARLLDAGTGDGRGAGTTSRRRPLVMRLQGGGRAATSRGLRRDVLTNGHHLLELVRALARRGHQCCNLLATPARRGTAPWGDGGRGGELRELRRRWARGGMCEMLRQRASGEVREMRRQRASSEVREMRRRRALGEVREMRVEGAEHETNQTAHASRI